MWPEMFKYFKNQKKKFDELYQRTDHLLDIIAALYNYIAEMPAPCDKCSDQEVYKDCFKCENTGVVKHKQLFNWPQ